jgi:hypothetical protein|tara:strand:+ start:295 stop:591 length:297 start_codon:yes stop_codon:yes gene_type:complete
MNLFNHIKNIIKNIGELIIIATKWIVLIGKGIFDVPMPKQRIEVEDDILEPDDMMDEVDDFSVSKALNPKLHDLKSKKDEVWGMNIPYVKELEDKKDE